MQWRQYVAWRRWRHLVIALMTCALVLAAYRMWTSTDRHVVRRDFRYASRRMSHRAATGGGASRAVLRRPQPAVVGDQLKTGGRKFHSPDSKVHAGNEAVPPVAVGTPRRASVDSDDVQTNSVTVNRPAVQQRARPHDEQTGITDQEHVDQIGLSAAAAAEEHIFSAHKNSSRHSRRKHETADEVSTADPGRRPRPPRDGAISSNTSHYSTARKTPATPTPIYLVVSDDEADAESGGAEVFREPEVVIRSADADKPYLWHRRAGAVNASGGGAVDRQYGPDGGKRSPLLGALRGGPGHCRVYRTDDELPELVDFAAGVDCVELATRPTAVVCPYPDDDDRHVSRPLRTHGVWEPHIVRLFQAALLTDRQLGVFDVGANVGQYSLLAAAMGRRVVAVEPHRPNIYRLHKAIRLGRLDDKVSVVRRHVAKVHYNQGQL